MSKFTQGPYEVNGHFLYTLQSYGFRKGQEQFCNRLQINVSGHQGSVPQEELEATVRLIAAAPEMYELLRELVNKPQQLPSMWLINKSSELLSRIDGDE